MSDAATTGRVKGCRGEGPSEAEAVAGCADGSLVLDELSRLPLRRTGGGVLLGIARHPRPRTPIETLAQAIVTCEAGIAGDFRGSMKGKPYRRQITLMERGAWEAALAEIGDVIPWQERRANLLIDGLDLPRRKGARLRIGADVVLETARETDPCGRMEKLAAGLEAALSVDWRGGVCTMVVTGGTIAVGDEIRIER